jgi:hypothetical protein
MPQHIDSIHKHRAQPSHTLKLQVLQVLGSTGHGVVLLLHMHTAVIGSTDALRGSTTAKSQHCKAVSACTMYALQQQLKMLARQGNVRSQHT